jgi:transposase
VQETNQPGMKVSGIVREYGFSPGLLFLWRNRLAEGGKKEIAIDDEVVEAAEVNERKRHLP